MSTQIEYHQMNVHLKILGFETLDAIPDYWSLQDYHALLERCEIDDYAQMSFSEAEEMLFMALSDMEADEIIRLTASRDEPLTLGPK